jgi:hypothetical protein
MRSVRKSLLGSLLRLAMVPLSLPCMCAAFSCCSVAVGSVEAQEKHLGLRLGGPHNAIENGVARGVGSDTLIAGTTEVPNHCCYCPVNSDAKRPLVVHRSTKNRTKSLRAVRLVLQTANALDGSIAVEFRSSILARAASCPTSAEGCILLCRLLL